MTRGNNAVDDIQRLSGSTNVSVVQLDLASLKSVRKFAEEIHKTEKRLDILINNAGKIEFSFFSESTVNLFASLL